MAEKRGLVLTLVIGTVVIFVGLVWAISTYLPLNLNASPSPTFTADAPRVAKNCASPIAFWKEHAELYPLQLVIAGKAYKSDNLKEIFSGQTEELPAKLQSQLTAAYLNILFGADQSYIETTIFEAYGWLIQHPAGTQVDDVAQEEGTRLLNLLEAYNLGMTGVKPCEFATLTLTEPRTVTRTATVFYTLTPSPTETPPASETPTPIEITATATYEYNPPTRVPIRTTEPPIQYPTNTAIPPTQAPAPTDTLVPTAAPTNTPAPTVAPTNTPVPPTPTYTLPPLPIPTNTLPPPP